MTREEYVARMNSEDDWAPGWDAVEEEFARLYPGKEPAHYGTEIHARAMFGGDIRFTIPEKATSILLHTE